MLFSLAFVNTLDSNGLNELKDLFTFSNFLIISFEIISSNSVCFVVLLNFWIVFSPVALFSATHVERVVCIVFKFCFCRDWRRISILENGNLKPKTRCFRSRGSGRLCKTGGCFYFLFSDCPLFCLSNFLCVVRITCHGVLLVFLHYRPSRWRSIG